MAKVITIAPNHSVVTFTDNGKSISQFFSYDVLICEQAGGELYFSTLWDFSKTTTKWLNIYLEQDNKTTKAMVADGRAQVVAGSDRETDRLSHNGKAAILV